MGGTYLFFGLNGFFHFVPTPSQSPEGQQFLNALYETGYMLYLWKTFEVVSGFLLLMNRYIALALLLIAPVTVNIFFFHLMLDESLNPIGFLLAVAQFFLMIMVFDQYRPVLKR